MDGARRDTLVRSLPQSRRSLLGGLLLAPGWLGISRVDAKKRRHKKRKPKAKPNEFGCLDVGNPCKSSEQCCSGICEGRKCRAHGTGTCPQDRVGICLAAAEEVPFLKCNNSASCFCYTTTAGSSFCAEGGPLFDEGASCADCQTDADCVTLGYPAGSACAPVGTGYCAGQCPTGMACLVPCGTELPEPAP